MLKQETAAAQHATLEASLAGAIADHELSAPNP